MDGLKKMENKYYTPDMSEFHIGFEYELYGGKDPYSDRPSWMSFKVQNSYEFNLIRLSKYVENNMARVKYLDKWDIESLGFKLKHSIVSYCYTYYTDDYSISLYDNGEVQINKVGYKSLNIIRQLFKGHIKNRSELRILLNQLGIDGK